MAIELARPAASDYESWIEHAIARSLYASLGYHVTTQQLKKTL